MNELEEYMSKPGFGKDDHDILRIENDDEEVQGYLVRRGRTLEESAIMLMTFLGIDDLDLWLGSFTNAADRGHLVSSGIDGRPPHQDDTFVYNKSQDGSLPFRKLSALCLHPERPKREQVVYSGWYFPSWLTDKDVRAGFDLEAASNA